MNASALPGASGPSPAVTPSSVPTLRRGWWAALALVAVLALAFQGTRGFWEPDEGFYSNVTLGMLTSGDFWTPRLNGEPFLDKPPLTYWSMAAGMALLGVDEWGARVGHALWFLGTALLAGLLAARLWGSAYGPGAAVAYAAMLAPFVAANVLTPDTPLAFFALAAAVGSVNAALARSPRATDAWAVTAALALGAGVLTKGPAILVFCFPLLVWLVVMGHAARLARRPAVWLALLLAVAIGGSWYVSMTLSWPDALSYLVDSQITGRLVSEEYARNQEWWAAFTVYVPTLLLGALPWSVLWPARLTRERSRWSRLGGWRGLRQRPIALLLGLWIFLPLVVLCAASSRLPLYALPLMAPLSLVAVRHLGADLGLGDTPRRRWLLAVWLVVLLGLKLGAALVPQQADSRLLAAALRAHGVAPSTLVVSVDIKHNALPLYGYQSFAWTTSAADGGYSFYTPLTRTMDELHRLGRSGRAALLIVQHSRADSLAARLALSGLDCRRSAGPFGYAFFACPGEGSPPAASSGSESSTKLRGRSRSTSP